MRSKLLPGATIFLFNISDGLLFGIFEAVSKAEDNLDPKLFSKNPNALTSPFPVQLKVRVVLECPPLEGSDVMLKQLLRDRGGKPKIGPLTFAQCKALANLVSERCGALEYMIGVSEKARRGLNYADPPITLPPKLQSR